jgi:AcrR family transcriptional regulator
MANLSPETRRRLLDAAAALFAQRSFDKVKMEDVAAEAKTGKATIYRYFPTKDDLYLKLLEDIGQEYLGRLREADESVRGCRARLVALVRAALDYFYGRPRLLELLTTACQRAAEFISAVRCGGDRPRPVQAPVPVCGFRAMILSTPAAPQQGDCHATVFLFAPASRCRCGLGSPDGPGPTGHVRTADVCRSDLRNT